MSEIREFVANEPLFNTHDHQAGFSQEWQTKRFDDFLGYATADLNTAGVLLDRRNGKGIFEVWPFVRTTGYGQAVELAVKTLFDLDFTAKQADTITEAMQALIRDRSPEAVYDDLFGRVNVQWTVNDGGGDNITPMDYFSGNNFPSSFKCALRYGRTQVLTATRESRIQDLERTLGWSISGLKDLNRLMDEHTERVKATGNLAAIKIALAYARALDFVDAPFSDADRIFTAILKGEEVEARPLHDYLVHRIFERAEAFDLPVQIHTGYLAGNWGDFRWGDPAPLIPVFQKYRNVKFDLFHAAWPYSEFMGAVGSAFPNVWIDLCWAWAMNPVQMERILDEWLSCVPSNKILGFGADTKSPFPVVGYAQQARRGIANVLQKKLETGEYDLATAQFVARRIMHQNARELFQM